MPNQVPGIRGAISFAVGGAQTVTIIAAPADRRAEPVFSSVSLQATRIEKSSVHLMNSAVRTGGVNELKQIGKVVDARDSARHLVAEPRLSQAQLAADHMHRHRQRFSGFFSSHTAEIAHFDQLYF